MTQRVKRDASFLMLKANLESAHPYSIVAKVAAELEGKLRLSL
jgi:hypothetical protein